MDHDASARETPEVSDRSSVPQASGGAAGSGLPVEPHAPFSPEPGQRYLVALDVDGTLVDHDGVMSPEVSRALRAVVDAGHHVVIATGRSRGATLPVVEQAGLARGYAVTSNGGVTLTVDPDLPGGYAVLDAAEFSPREALLALHERIPGARFALEQADGSFAATRSFQDRSFGIQAREVPFEELLDRCAVRVVVSSEDMDVEDFAEAIERSGLHGVTYSVGWTPWLDVAAHGVSKASALEAVRSRLGVDPAHTVAVGDGFNDVEMLAWAGHGVAMGQAPEGVQAVADEVTGSVYEDGAGAILRRLA